MRLPVSASADALMQAERRTAGAANSCVNDADPSIRRQRRDLGCEVPRLAEALQASLSGDELAKYVVRNLGFIAATESDGSVRLRLRPAVVSPTALSALLYWLHDQTDRARADLVPRRGVVARAGAVARRGRAGAAGAREVQRGRSRRRLPAAAPAAAARSARHQPAARRARCLVANCGGKFDRERLRPLLEKALNGRFVLVESAANSPNVYVKDVGSGFGEVGPNTG